MRETNSKPSKTTKQSDSDEIQETEAAIGYLTDLAGAQKGKAKKETLAAIDYCNDLLESQRS